jgi:hypothetical protein
MVDPLSSGPNSLGADYVSNSINDEFINIDMIKFISINFKINNV